MEIRLVGVELFHEDWQAEMWKLIVPFRSVANAPIR
jgi:hypothetical protein